MQDPTTTCATLYYTSIIKNKIIQL